MKVLYLSKYSFIGPSSRYRIYQYLPYLSGYGIDVEIRPFLEEAYFKIIDIDNVITRNILKILYAIYRYLARLVDTMKAGDYELVVIEQQVFPYLPPFMDKILKVLNKHIIVEFDDAIFLTHPGKIPAVIKMSNTVIVGNNFLRDYAAKFSKKVVVVPTVIDIMRYPLHCHASEKRIMICWIGLAYNIHYLKEIGEVLRKLSMKHKVCLMIISNKYIKIDGVEVLFRKWSYEAEVEELQRSDIGIMPLIDDDWSRGKCGLKLLQYMAAGLPSVASPVGENKEIILDGENGFLASRDDEWYEKLLRLCEDHELRRRLGLAGRKTIQERYSIDIWAPRLVEVYKSNC